MTPIFRVHFVPRDCELLHQAALHTYKTWNEGVVLIALTDRIAHAMGKSRAGEVLAPGRLDRCRGHCSSRARVICAKAAR